MELTSLIQTAVAVVGFAAVIYQLFQVEKSLRASARSSIYSMAATVKQNIIDDPALKPYFYDGKELNSEDSNYNKVIAMADLYSLYLEKIATQSESISKDNKDAWAENYITEVYNNCPAVREHLHKHKNSYSDELWDILIRK
jgi:hypothetical protein